MKRKIALEEHMSLSKETGHSPSPFFVSFIQRCCAADLWPRR
jgi:hypothetical protein